jgi:hypothetical protein
MKAHRLRGGRLWRSRAVGVQSLSEFVCGVSWRSIIRSSSESALSAPSIDFRIDAGLVERWRSNPNM